MLVAKKASEHIRERINAEASAGCVGDLLLLVQLYEKLISLGL